MIAAIILAAGQSRRMGRPKMVLPWGETTVIGKVVRLLAEAGAAPLVVVTGGARQEVEEALVGLPASPVFNPRFAEGEMASSLQVGLSALPEECQAALVVLGDQPQIELATVQGVMQRFRRTQSLLVVPSYHMHRGHPWLIARALWPAVLALKPGETMRDLLNAFAEQIDYLPVETATILHDLDTQEDYQRHRPPRTSA